MAEAVRQVCDPTYLSHQWTAAIDQGFSPYLIAAGCSVGYVVSQNALFKLTDKYGMNLGIKGEQTSGDKLLDTIYEIDSFTSGPVAEELIFRGAVGSLMGTSWQVGVPASILFALRHNISVSRFELLFEPKNLKKNLKNGFDTSYVPLPQFLGGLISWGLFAHYGLGPAIAEHIITNGICLGIDYFANNQERKN